MRLNLKSNFCYIKNIFLKTLKTHFKCLFSFLNFNKPFCLTFKIKYLHLLIPFSFMSICILFFGVVHKSYFVTFSSAVSAFIYLLLIILYLQNTEYFTSFRFMPVSSYEKHEHENATKQTLTNRQLIINGKSLTIYDSAQVCLISYWGECAILTIWIFASALFTKFNFVLEYNDFDLLTALLLALASIYITFGKFSIFIFLLNFYHFLFLFSYHLCAYLFSTQRRLFDCSFKFCF